MNVVFLYLKSFIRIYMRLSQPNNLSKQNECSNIRLRPKSALDSKELLFSYKPKSQSPNWCRQY